MIKWLLATPPAIGSKWDLEGSNPFSVYQVTVLEVRKGWVKYAYSTGGFSSLTIRMFRTLYGEPPNAQV